MQTIAAVARQPHGDFTLEPVEIETPREGEVRVRIAGVGLCHTDLIFRDQFVPYPLPAVLGHEGAGVIEALGPGVEGLAVGDAGGVGLLGFWAFGLWHWCSPKFSSISAHSAVWT